MTDVGERRLAVCEEASHGALRVACAFPLAPVARAEVARRFFLEDVDPITLRQGLEDGPDVLLLGPPVLVDHTLLSRLPPSIRAIATYSVGLDHIDLDAVRASGLPLFNTPSVLSQPGADHALLLILAAARRSDR